MKLWDGSLWLGLCGSVLVQAGCAALPPGAVPGWPSAAAPTDELPPDKAIQACLVVAQNMEKNGSEAEAIGQYERVERLDPADLQVTRHLALLYDRRCDFTKADTEYRKLAKAKPRDSDTYNDWGYSYYERHQWVEAESKLNYALKLNPANSRARANLGLVLGQQERYQEAFEAFRPIVGDAQAHVNLAFVFWSKGKLQEARRECQAAQRLEPTCRQANAMLAQLDRAGAPLPASGSVTVQRGARQGR